MRSFSYSKYPIIIIVITLALVLLLNTELNALVNTSAIAQIYNSTVRSNISSEPKEKAPIIKELNNVTTKTLEQFTTPPLSSEEDAAIEESIDESFVSQDLPTSNKTIEGPSTNERQTLSNDTQLNSTIINEAIPNETILSGLTDDDNNNNNTISNSLSLNTTNETSLKSNQSMLPDETTIKLYISKALPSPSNASLSLSTEPSVASDGQIILITGNKFIARSADNGTTWKYFNIKSNMSDFCCDQDLIYDFNHKMFVWYRQGDQNCNGDNRFVLGVSSDGLTWDFREMKPKDLDSEWSNLWFDYPQVALGSKYIYITTNIINTTNLDKLPCKDNHPYKRSIINPPVDEFEHAVIIRVSIDDLSNLNNATVSPEYSFFEDPSSRADTITPVQGATDTIYWATHLSDSMMRIYAWNESDPWTNVTYYDREIPRWAKLTQSDDCPYTTNQLAVSPTLKGWCKRADYRITNGWLSGDTIGFLWNADSGGNKSTHGAPFQWPYINGAMFNIKKEMAYVGRPYIWSPDFAWMYGYAVPNKQGDLGIVAVFGGGSFYPSIAIGIATDIDKNSTIQGKFWKMMPLIYGTDTPDVKKWGDYVRVRNYNNSSDLWIGTGFTLQGGKSDKFIEPQYFIFGRN
jgi:hypothetical protein